MKTFDITVLLFTYNHAPYIKQAIESVLSQKTKYNYIIKIFDDASTDGSSDIIRKYAKKYPQKIEAHIAKKNQGGEINIWNGFKSVTTKYCALLETDDYWCDENKIEKQIEALERYPECSCAAAQTKIIVLNKDKFFSNESLHTISPKKNIIRYEDIVNIEHSFFPHTSSICINMEKIDLSKIVHTENLCYDCERYFYLLSQGPYFYSEDIVSVYRRTGLGIASSRKNYEAMQVLAEKLLEINRDTNFIFWKKIFSYINVISSYRIRKDNDNIVLDYKTKVLDSNKKEYKLKFIPFIKVIHSRTKIKYMLGKINIIKIKNKKNKNKIYLLGIPILKFTKKHLK